MVVSHVSRADRMRDILQREFQPSALTIEDESARHAGHAGAGGEETHYSVWMVSAIFAGRSRIECNRMVNTVLKDEFASGLHALSLKLQASRQM